MLTVKATQKNCIALKRFYEHRRGAHKRGIPFLVNADLILTHLPA
jgi:hypothetical protein